MCTDMVLGETLQRLEQAKLVDQQQKAPKEADTGNLLIHLSSRLPSSISSTRAPQAHLTCHCSKWSEEAMKLHPALALEGRVVQIVTDVRSEYGFQLWFWRHSATMQLHQLLVNRCQGKRKGSWCPGHWPPHPGPPRLKVDVRRSGAASLVEGSRSSDSAAPFPPPCTYTMYIMSQRGCRYRYCNLSTM